MSGTDNENNRKPGVLETMITLPTKYVMSAVGAALSISGFVALVTTRSVKTWVKSHPYPIYLALIVAVLFLAGTLDYAYNMRKQIKLPSDHDKKLYGAVLERLPANGAVVGWLKQAEMTDAGVTDFPADVLGALDKTIEFSQKQPVGFDDAQLARSFLSLIEAITGFCRSVENWTFAVHAWRLKGIMAPPPGKSEPGQPLSEISHSPVSPRAFDADMKERNVAHIRRHHELVKAYDHFIRTAHARGIDIDR